LFPPTHQFLLLLSEALTPELYSCHDLHVFTTNSKKERIRRTIHYRGRRRSIHYQGRRSAMILLENDMGGLSDRSHGRKVHRFVLWRKESGRSIPGEEIMQNVFPICRSLSLLNQRIIVHVCHCSRKLSRMIRSGGVMDAERRSLGFPETLCR